MTTLYNPAAFAVAHAHLRPTSFDGPPGPEAPPAPTPPAPTPPAPTPPAPTPPTDNEAKLLREVMALKEKNRLAEEHAKQFEGLDPVKAKEAVAAAAAAAAAAEAAEAKKLEEKGEYTRLIKKIEDDRAAEKKAAEEAKLAADNALAESKRHVEDMSIGMKFNGSTFISEKLVLTPSKTKTLYGSHFEFVEGVLVGFDKPKGEPNRTRLVDNKGGVLDFEAAIEKIISADPEFERLARDNTTPGGSSSTTKDRDGKQKPPGASSLDKISAGLKALK